MRFVDGFIGWLTGREDREFIASANGLRLHVSSVPLDDARKQIAGYLTDPTRFRCVPATSALTLPREVGALPRLVTELFSQYESIEIGETRLERSAIAISLISHRFVRIGTDIEHAQIVVCPPAEQVYETDGLERETGDGSLDEYPTIYHFLLFHFRLRYPGT